MTAFALPVVAALLAGFGLLMLLLFAAAMVRAVTWRRETIASAARLPAIREALVDHLGGSDEQSRLRSLLGGGRGILAAAIMGFQGTVAGSALDRLCALAMELGLVHEWIAETHSRDPLRRRAAFAGLAFVSASASCRPAIGDLLVLKLNDADPEVRLWAAVGAAQSTFGDATERVFDFALSRNLLVRILLAQPLRRHALSLSEAAIPAALASSDSSRVLAALEILVSWERSVPFDNLLGLLEHPDRRVRIQILKLAPLVPPDDKICRAIVRALEDPDTEVSVTASLSSARLKIAEALPALARLVRSAPAGVARGAASALAAMPPRGWRTLEELSASSGPVAAAIAGAALARARGEAVA